MRLVNTVKVLSTLVSAALVSAMATHGVAEAATQTNPSPQISIEDQVLTSARQSLAALSRRSNASDTQFFADGRFRYDGIDCRRCELGPAVAAGTLYRRTGDPELYRLATQAMDTAIRSQGSDGGFTRNNALEGGNLIQTIFFAEHLGTMLIFMGPSLDADRRQAYSRALTKAVDNIVDQGILTYYVNGNINLAATVAIGMAWKQTNQARYGTLYEKSLSFTMNPPSNRWGEFGFRLTKSGSAPYGRDSAGYLGEKGKGKAGFDPEYTQFQADIASQGWQALRDTRLLTLSNRLNNRLMPLVNKTTWVFDIKGGSRQNRPYGYERFSTPATYINARSGGPYSIATALSQVSATTDLMIVSGTTAWPGIYQAWGTKFATLIYTIA